MSRIQQISGNFISAQYSGISNSIVTNYLSATTLFGNIDAKYIGTGSTFGEVPNWVNNSEFSYLSGITAHVQTQINEKSSSSLSYLTTSSSPNLTNSKIISADTNIKFVTTSTGLTINQWIGALEFGSISVSTSGDSSYSVNNLTLSGSANLYIQNCFINGNLSKSGGGYLSMNNIVFGNSSTCFFNESTSFFNKSFLF